MSFYQKKRSALRNTPEKNAAITANAVFDCIFNVSGTILKHFVKINIKIEQNFMILGFVEKNILENLNI